MRKKRRFAVVMAWIAILLIEYNDLLQTWNLNDAVNLLAGRPEYFGQGCPQLYAPNADSVNDK